jgi:hypothetical protein
MVVGVPGAGLSTFFYLLCVVFMPLHAIWRLVRGRPVTAREVRLIVRQWVLGMGLLATLAATGLVVAASIDDRPAATRSGEIVARENLTTGREPEIKVGGAARSADALERGAGDGERAARRLEPQTANSGPRVRAPRLAGGDAAQRGGISADAAQAEAALERPVSAAGSPSAPNPLLALLAQLGSVFALAILAVLLGTIRLLALFAQERGLPAQHAVAEGRAMRPPDRR